MPTTNRAALILALHALLVACDPTPDAPATDPSPTPLRTADPYARGYTDDDFPRVQELAPGVYSYEQLRSAGDERFTTVSMFVVTDEGVLVADGQGSPAETRRLIETIATVTDRPVTHVVVCSDHGDHTAGNAEFPATARFYAHPTSQAVLQRAADNPLRPATAPPIVVPTDLVETAETLHLGGREIRILFLGRAPHGGRSRRSSPRREGPIHERGLPAPRLPRHALRLSERVGRHDRGGAGPRRRYPMSPVTASSIPPEVLAEELETYRQALVQVIGEATRLHAAGLTLEQAVEQADFGDLENWSLRAKPGAARDRTRVHGAERGAAPGVTAPDHFETLARSTHPGVFSSLPHPTRHPPTPLRIDSGGPL